MASLNLTRFLSDFTLGFSDGLTVPFALTAGLSSLGRSETVIFAGLAELCAGCISMDIGGYLAARDASREYCHKIPAASEEEQGMLLAERHSEEDGGAEGEEKESPTKSGDEEVVLRYLMPPLGLSETTLSTVLEAVKSQPGGPEWASKRIQSSQSALISENRPEHSIINQEVPPASPIFSGLSISLGYLCGGIMPLSPYFFAPSVGQGLYWSIAICLVALLSFGTGKSWALGTRRGFWRGCLWEGVQMAFFGSCAAGAAVLCVTLVNEQVT